MARYARDSVDKVRDATDFGALVGARTELRRAGPRRLQGLCPFHEERTPSFGIDPVDKWFKCFGCGEGGDVFSFVMKTEGLDFVGALEWLADRAGIELEREDEDPKEAERRQRRGRLLELLDRTTTYYERVLWDSAEAADAREYLLGGRGLSEAVLRTFRVGYAPSRWDRVLLASRRAGFSEAELLAVGLAQRGRGGLQDRFRERIIFPLADARGRVVGFGARRMRENQHPAKYLNSADGELFHKSRILYGAHLARAEAARAGAVVLVEGYTDVIALHQSGIVNTVAQMGTSLTEEQVVELGRLAPTVLLCLDADAAGQEAMLRAAKVAAGRRLELRVVPMPAGSDPADVLQAEGAAAMRALLDRAVPFARFQVERALATADSGSSEGRDRALAVAAPVITALPPSILRDELVRLVASRLALSERLTAELLTSAATAPAAGAARPGTGSPGARPARGEGADAPADRRPGAGTGPVSGRASVGGGRHDAEARPPSGDQARRVPTSSGGGSADPGGDAIPADPGPEWGAGPPPLGDHDVPFGVQPDGDPGPESAPSGAPTEDWAQPPHDAGARRRPGGDGRRSGAGRSGRSGRPGQRGRADRGPRRDDRFGVPQSPPGPGAAAVAIARREQTERSFLAHCLALPDHGARRLAELDIPAHFTSELMRRAAAFLREHVHDPGRHVPPEDRELSSLIAELALRGHETQPDLQSLHAEQLQLELLRIERELASRPSNALDLVAARQKLRDELRRATLGR